MIEKSELKNYNFVRKINQLQRPSESVIVESSVSKVKQYYCHNLSTNRANEKKTTVKEDEIQQNKNYKNKLSENTFYYDFY